MGRVDHPGPLAVDLQALQSPMTRTRGIGRYAADFALALEEHRPDLVGRYLLNPRLPPPAPLEPLLATGKLAYVGDADAIGPWTRVLHLLSPLDTSSPTAALWPAQAARAGVRLSVTVYDLIPAAEPTTHLADPLERRRYRTHLELVRAAERLLVLSRAAASDLERLLGCESRRIVEVGAAPSREFLDPPRPHEDGPVRPPYVLYPSGHHPRKNNERLVEAFALLPEALRGRYRLVVSGDFPAPAAHHLQHLAAGRFELCLPGRLPSWQFAALVANAALVCFPSLAEGFGLPVAEALACGTPVIASDRPPLDELVEREGRFDPESAVAIARAIAAALGDDALRRRLAVGRPGAVRTWRTVAERAGEAFDELLAAPRRPSRRRRRRLAVVTPLPPSPTGVAAYSFRLLEQLSGRRHLEVEAFADGPTPGQVAPDGVARYKAASLRRVEALTGGYDAVLYVLGNSHHHLGALRLLRERRGSILSHDVRLTNLYRHEHGDPGLRRGGLARAIAAMYGDAIPAGLGDNEELSPADLESYGLYLAREAVTLAERFLVTSRAAVQLARLDAGGRGTILPLPFAIAAPDPRPLLFTGAASRAPDGLAQAGRWWGQHPEGFDGPLIAHFGIVDPIKRPELLVEAAACCRGSHPKLRLAFVGPVADELARDLARQAEQAGLGDALVLTGALPPAAYRAWLDRCLVAIQLRAGFNGEASAAVGECLACGVATVVTELGWMRELPDDAVEKVAPTLEAGELAAVVSRLLVDEARRARLGRRGRDLAAHQGFDAVADAVLDALAL
ncbi:MAG TPA: glycosyltransferase [Acidimicrobiales bacterium]|nr:glycosyltransferase [Acidimicrobiales bacterium]